MSFPIRDHLGRSLLFDLGPVDLPDPLEYEMYHHYRQLPANRSELDSYALSMSRNSPQTNDQILKALIYGILVDKDRHTVLFQTAQIIVNDDWRLFVKILKHICNLNYKLISSPCRERIFLLLDRLLAINANDSSSIIINILRNVKPGCQDPLNTVTILHLLDILVLHIDWLKAQSETAPYIVYPLLRIASEDRVDYEVRKKLIFMCLNILEKFSRECSILGRDLVRCLIEVYQIDEFQNFWYRLLKREKKIETMLKLNLETISKPSFDEEREGKSNTIPDNELMHLLQKKASISYIKMRIAPQMESDINFIIHELGGCNNEFHINLFIETYQPRDDPGAFVSDTIRYILCLIPHVITEESKKNTRFLISALVKSLNTGYDASRAKLALCIDLFFEDADEKQNPRCSTTITEEIMKLIFENSHIDSRFSSTLIEYMYLSRSKIYPPDSEACSVNLGRKISSSIVSGSLGNLLTQFKSCPQISPKIKEMLDNLASSLN